jgi:flagellar hook-associated protein 1 FlgK
MIGDRLRELDQLAFDFATEFNAAHETGVGLDGTGGRPFFEIGGTAPGAALSIAVNADIDGDASLLATATNPADLPGGSDLLGTLIAFEDSPLAGGQSLHDGLIGITQALGTDVREALDATAATSSAIAQLEQVQAATSGVSLEEELLQLNEAQRAYQASLKVIEASESMMDSLMSIGR